MTNEASAKEGGSISIKSTENTPMESKKSVRDAKTANSSTLALPHGSISGSTSEKSLTPIYDGSSCDG